MILAILQARFSSTRLPGKVLRPLLGEPMLLRQIERIQRAGLINRLIVATSTEAADDQIAAVCGGKQVECFRGNLNDVLDRFYRTAVSVVPEHVVRLTGDCPLTDPELIDRIISFHLAGGYDYSSNTIQPTFPDGLDVEVFRFDALSQAWQEATLSSQREHVTPFIHQQSKRFRLGSYINGTDLSRLRWTVDEPDDFALVTKIYGALYPFKPDFSTTDIMEYLDVNPVLATINTGHRRNEGYEASLLHNDPPILKGK